jgi:hypothetical protein
MKVYIVPGLWVAHIRGIFLEAGYTLTQKIEDAGIVVWTGGADIHPSIYNEKPLPQCYFDLERDQMESEVFKALPKTGGPLKVGICRGAQLLNALSGGKLWQHIEGHPQLHDVMDIATGELIQVSSLHHQEMVPPDGARVWARAAEATEKIGMFDGLKKMEYKAKREGKYEDVEAIYIPQTESFCFQPHPEIGPTTCTEYFFKLVHRSLLFKAKFPKRLVEGKNEMQGMFRGLGNAAPM